MGPLAAVGVDDPPVNFKDTFVPKFHPSSPPAFGFSPQIFTSILASAAQPELKSVTTTE